jgi:hypothetical protein
MLALLRPRGYVATNHDGYRSARVVVSTTGRMPSWPAVDDRPRLLVEAPAARWDGEETALAEGVQLIVCPGPKARPGGRCPALDGETCPLAEQADTIVTHLGERFDADLERAHGELHSGVPVCVHHPGGNVFEVATHAAELAKEHKRS